MEYQVTKLFSLCLVFSNKRQTTQRGFYINAGQMVSGLMLAPLGQMK